MRILFFILIVFISQCIFAADNLYIKDDAPLTYTVKPGDTLMGIAKMYLDNPMRWRALLEANPQVKNPYKIYPGQVLNLELVNGQKHLVVSGGGTVKLSPRIRSKAITQPIPVIPLEVIRPFLSSTRVVSRNELNYAPYVVSGADEHVATGAGDRVYVAHLNAPVNKDFAIFRMGNAYKNPNTNQVLGFEATHVGDGKVTTASNPATLLITQSNQEILPKDRLLPATTSQFNDDFEITKPSKYVVGDIVAVLNGVTQISQYQVVVIDLGKASGLIPGNILAIYQKGAKIENPIKPLVGYNAKLQLPSEWSGDLMIFRVFDSVSYGVVLHATRALKIGDEVTNPHAI